MRPFAIGNDSFGEIRFKNFKFIDKSLFIKEIFDNSGIKVTLITRPRRFGKTLNLSMLHHFLSPNVFKIETAPLFEGLKITQYPEIMAHQGQYPVIFITLKGIKATSFETALADFAGIMRDLYKVHQYLRDSPQFAADDQIAFDRILQLQCQVGELHTAITQLCRWLAAYHLVNPWVLIDEYDTPIQTAYLNGYYPEMIALMQPVFGNTLKTNPYLERAILTGITRVSKESLFSDLNNVQVYTLFKQDYSEHFGFTEPEMDALLIEAELTHRSPDIKRWYNGYLCGDTVLYNPWSIISCLTEKGELAPYWVHTGGTSMIQSLLAKADASVKTAFEELLQGRSIQARISDHLVFGLFGADLDAVMSLLLAAGYLKALTRTQERSQWLCTLAVPNYEVLALFEDCIMMWFTTQGENERYAGLLQALIVLDPEFFEEQLQELLLQTASYFDVGGKNPEKFYHGLILGMLIQLKEHYVLESNRESGLGQYDVMLIPQDVTKPGIVMEFKVVRKSETLETAANNALTQIHTRHYATTLRQRGITRILAMGLAFQGKLVNVKYEWLAS
ncbi:MAG: hypothetical protein A3J38_08835 [Gammaproteobacteria bacterium RIFCSPHIGHO2_12_FULL_45_9]|nr:MAG: hypothetical protein A3J38_08835 [Gammaproteobacteria bacterium RIFCSPHIGHO2_12_FULL_45_9]